MFKCSEFSLKQQYQLVQCSAFETNMKPISPSTSPPAAACPSSSQLSSRLVVFVTFLTTKDVYTQGKKYDCLIMHCSISQTFLKTNTTLFWSIMKANSGMSGIEKHRLRAASECLKKMQKSYVFDGF